MPLPAWPLCSMLLQQCRANPIKGGYIMATHTHTQGEEGGVNGKRGERERGEGRGRGRGGRVPV